MIRINKTFLGYLLNKQMCDLSMCKKEELVIFF